MASAKINYPALTGVRAIAAYCVFIHHFNFFKPDIFGIYIYNFFSELHIGVTMFFVLSGLLLTLRYYEGGVKSIKNFYNFMVNRFARIYPVYFLIITVHFIIYMNNGYFENTPIKNGWLYYIGSLTFLRGFFADFYNVFISQSWSLTVEECFYLLCPFLFILQKKYKKSIFFLPVLLISVGCILVILFHGNPYGFFKDFRFLFNFTFFGRCIEFFAGIGLALIFMKYKQLKKYRIPWFTILGLASMTICIFMLSLLHNKDHYGDYYPLGIVINNLILPVTGICIFYWGLLTETSLIRRILETNLFKLLGKSSYAFYLIHVSLFLTLFIKYVNGNPILVFIFLNAVSILIYKFYEHPLNNYIRKKLSKK